MPRIHKELTLAKWTKLSLPEQMANVGADVGRAIRWRDGGERKRSQRAFERALELFDLTINANLKRSKEIARAREVYCDYFFENIYQTSAESWDKYFLPYNYLARINR